MPRSVYPVERASGAGVTISSQAVPAPTAAQIGDGLQGDDGTPTPPPTTQHYLDRVQNYIPAEIVAFFIFVNSLIAGDPESPEAGAGSAATQLSPDNWVGIAALVIGLVGCWVYSKAVSAKDGNPAWKLQALLWSIAFLIWIYAIDAKVLEVFDIDLVPSVSGLLLAGFTLLSGFIVPAKAKAG